MGEAVRGWSARQKNVILGTLFVLEFVLALLPPVHWAAVRRRSQGFRSRSSTFSPSVR
jgi:hypothetical protein